MICFSAHRVKHAWRTASNPMYPANIMISMCPATIMIIINFYLEIY